jgi:hypothetical protein
MKIDKRFFICAMLVLMLFLCVNASSATEPLNETLGADIGDEIAVSDAPSENLSASGDTYVVDGIGGGGKYATISDAVGAATGGETIFIKNGEYIVDSTITFEKSLDIVGESKDGVTIKSSMPSSELFVSTTDGITLSFSNLIIKDSSKTGGTGFIRFGSTVNADFADCTFQNITNKYGVMQLSTTGTVNIENCKFIDIKCSTSNGAAGVYTSAGTTINITSTVFDNGRFTPSTGQVGGVLFMSSAGSKLYMDNVTIQNFNGPANSVVRGNGIVDIRKSKIINNTVTLSASGSVGESLFYIPGNGQLTIEQTIIADNSIAKNVFYFASSGSGSATVNYNNIYNNTHDSTYEGGYKTTAGTLNADYNYWGSNDVPSDVVTTNHVIKDTSGNYVLNTTGEALEKDIPELGDEGGDEPQSSYDVYASPDGDGDGSTKDTPTTLANAVEIVPEGGSILLCNGNYVLQDYVQISKSLHIFGESRDDVIISAQSDYGAFIIADFNHEMDDLNLDSVTLSDLTFDDGYYFVSVFSSVAEMNITNCYFYSSAAMMSPITVGNTLVSDITQGTLNFKKNKAICESAVPLILVGGDWDANINDNILIGDVIEAGSNGVIDANYNYWSSESFRSELDPENWIMFTASTDTPVIYTDETATISIATTLNDGVTDAGSHLPDFEITADLSAAGTLSDTSVVLVNGAKDVTYSSATPRTDNIAIEIFEESLNVPITVNEKYAGIVYVDVAGNDTNEGSIDAPVATIAKAIEIANEGSHEIIINQGTYVGCNYTVSDNLTVTGAGKVTLDANSEGGFFATGYPTSAAKIELSNLILVNAKGGSRAGSGCAVNSFAAEVILDNVTIVNSQANGYLIKSSGKLTIRNSNITKSMSGDVIQQTSNGDIVINNTVFEDNLIDDSYGVIYISSGRGNLVIEDSKFINNTAKQGVIKTNTDYNAVVKGSEFINNTNSLSYGGAIYAYGNTLTVSDSTFINNKASKDGGAIYVGWRTTATVDKSIFINNAAGTTSEGDAIYNGNKLSVNNSVLLTNAAHHLIYNDGDDNVVYAQNNWWGTNDDPQDLVASGYYEDDWDEEQECGEVDVSNWATMDASFVPVDAQAGDAVTVVATFSNPNLPDGIEVTFTSTSGVLNTVVSTVAAEASTNYTIDANDDAIYATSGSAEIEMLIASSYTTNIVTQDNFYDFFDDSGVLKADVPYDELIFQGNFSGLAAGYVIVNKGITITGDNAVLNNMGFMITSDGVILDNIALVATTSLGDLIAVTASDVDLTNLDISYIVDDEMANAISVSGTGTIVDVTISNSNIYFESHVTSDEDLTTAINLDGVQSIIVDGNNITANIPSLYVETYDYTYFMMGLCYVNPVRVYDSYDIQLINNNIDVTVNSYDASFPTVQALYIVASEDVLVEGNNITMVDDLTPAGTAIYLYAVECGFSEGIEFLKNTFDISTTGGKSGAGSAYALQVATSEAEFIGNNITCESNGPNLGIYSPYGFGPAKDLIIKDNFINVTGYAAGSSDYALVSGIEIQTGYATIYNNTVYVQNKADYGANYPVSGISAVQYSAKTLSFDIQNNTIYTDGKYTVEMLYPPSEAIVTGNTLYAHELMGDDSVYINLEIVIL